MIRLLLETEKLPSGRFSIPLPKFPRAKIVNGATTPNLADLARAKAVSRGWKAAAEEPDVLRRCFKAQWGLTSLVGEPRRPSFYLSARLPGFVLEHVCRPADSIMSVALRYGVSEVSIRMANALMSEHSLRSRCHIFVPARSIDQVRGKELTSKISVLLSRGLKIDKDTAQFYLDAARGDIKEAYRCYEADMVWEAQQRCSAR
ncbi:hypothetical protein WJX72_007945 [[Myrmecia] bisecta]|uniref:LysM domain-containing protein n=1 Tax=[Myrmecia] bisecta TaxID=41462 RepID=A0AAW1QRC5_9CHLO